MSHLPYNPCRDGHDWRDEQGNRVPPQSPLLPGRCARCQTERIRIRNINGSSVAYRYGGETRPRYVIEEEI